MLTAALFQRYSIEITVSAIVARPRCAADGRGSKGDIVTIHMQPRRVILNDPTTFLRLSLGLP